MTTPSSGWTILNPGLIERGLAQEAAPVRDAVLLAIQELLKDPMGPTNIAVRPLRGIPAHIDPGVLLAQLPGGWTLSYEAYPEGLMPLAGPLIKVRAFVRLL